jgi:hypothetical protein
MGWAKHYINKIRAGETVQFRPHGNSMQGRIESGQLVTVAPVDKKDIKVGDAVLCKVNGQEYLHLVYYIEENYADMPGRRRFQIGNAKGYINGWTEAVYGKHIPN